VASGKYRAKRCNIQDEKFYLRNFINKFIRKYELENFPQLEFYETASVVLRTVWNLKTRIPARDCVANPRDTPAIAVVYALPQAGIHRF